jgi:hypothetical protein
MHMSYWRFAAMIATSTVVMFVLMYLNTYALDHVYWSETRAWMALVMGATMAVIMLGFMLAMYRNRMVNLAIFIGSALVFALSLWLVRSQATVNDVDYMKAMIPHHSIAIMTSKRAQISEPRVRKLADEIIAAQRREIAEMKFLVRELQAGHAENALHDAQVPPEIVSPGEAIDRADIAKTDPGEMDSVEIEKVLGRGPRCSFGYARDAGPVLAASLPAEGGKTANGVVKIHGRLVRLVATYGATPASSATGLTLVANGIQVSVDPLADDGVAGSDRWREATARLRLQAGLKVGYGGFYRCQGAHQGGPQKDGD